VTEREPGVLRGEENPPVAARAPYNFIPVSEEVLFRYDNAGQLPPFGMLDPQLKSGEIFLTLTAESPVFFRGTSAQDQEAFPFYSVNGSCAVPAAALRGEIRSNLRILTCAQLRPGADYFGGRLLYRQPHLPKEGKIRRPLAEAYIKALGIDPSAQVHGSGRLPKPENVRAGYLHRRGNAYFIRPAEHAPFWMKPTDPVLCSFLAKEWFRVWRNDDLREELAAVYYRTDGSGRLVEISCEEKPGMRAGVLIHKEKWKRRRNSYLFPRELAGGQEIPLSQEDVRTCEESARAELLPKSGRARPVFYLRQETEDGVRIYFGNSWYLHIAFRQGLMSGLPAAHRERPSGVDYVCALFGQMGLRSRVFFEDCKLESTPAASLPQVSHRLNEPKLTYCTNYVLDKKNYDDPEFRLRGHKQYWLKNPDLQALEIMAREQSKRSGFAENNKTKGFVPLPAGTRFCGSIRFRNLHPDELGALLWALKLENGCFHSMGRGRAEGFGRMKAEIGRMVCYDMKTHYQSLLPAQTDETERVEEYIEAYQTFAAARLSDGKRPEERPEIRDFFYMRKTICSGSRVQYMERKECGDVKIPLPTVRDIREGRVKLC